ncbi:TetR/AcrR family transcriptional regulator [Actinomadura sp. B10D3]|uniref:TetR/AcrR family transcriptional regulator n=1 Tax=Actinomadura sp. B10D3 TaxID=3153557 RepID=UPI00325F1727
MVEVGEQSLEEAGGRIPRHVLLTAARLFSEVGYDETTTQLIADACGIDCSVVRDAYGGKRGVYLAVMAQLTKERMDYLAPVVATFTPDADGLIRLIDRNLDYALEHEELPSIWVHRWMSDATDFTDLEARYGLPPFRMVNDMVAQCVDGDVDPELFTWHVAWLISGFVRGGFVGADGVRRHADDPQALHRFRLFLHQTARRAAAR